MARFVADEGASVSWKSCPNAAKSCKLAGINPYPGPEAPAKVWIAVSAQAFPAAPGSCLFGDSSIMATSFPLTKHGAQLLKDELQRLKSVERPNVINAIAEARAQGDLSENAEYESAKERQSFIEGRIAELEGKLSAAQIIDPAALDADGRVVFGATVQLEDIDSGDKVTYQIVGEDEADLKLSKISVASPLARALIGKYAGDVASFQAPGGEREYEILDVLYR